MVILSDPLDFNLPRLAISRSASTSRRNRSPTATAPLAYDYISKEGDFSGAAAIADATTTESYHWLAGVDVLAPPDAALIIALGDSITDGIRSTNESNHTCLRYWQRDSPHASRRRISQSGTWESAATVS